MNMFRRSSWAFHLSLYSLSISVTLCQNYHTPSKEYVLVPKEYLDSTIHDFRSPYEAIQRPDRSAGSMYPIQADEPTPYQEYYSSNSRANNLYSQIEKEFYKHTSHKNSYPPSEYWERSQAQDTRKSYGETNNERTSSPGYHNRAPYHQLYPSPNQLEGPITASTPAPRPRPTYEYEPTPVKYKPAPNKYEPVPVQYEPPPLEYEPTTVKYRPSPNGYGSGPVKYKPSPNGYESTPVNHRPSPNEYEPAPVKYEDIPEVEEERFPNFKDRKRHVAPKRQKLVTRQPSRFVPTVPSVPITSIGSTITKDDIFAKAQSGELKLPHKRPSLTLLDEDYQEYSRPNTRPQKYPVYEEPDIDYNPSDRVPIHLQKRPDLPKEQSHYVDYQRPVNHESYPDYQEQDYSERPRIPRNRYQPVEAPDVHSYTEDYYSSPPEDEVSEQVITRRYTPPRKSSYDYPGENDFRGPPSKTSRPNKDIFITPPPSKKSLRYKSKKTESPPAIDPKLEAEKKKHKDIQLHNLQKLIDYADGGSRSKDPSDFTCPRDGHFGDKDDCAKFYRCAHGTALVEYCPGDLFWNSVTEQCDWPEAVDCSYTAKSLENYQLSESDPVTIYLTFDDGPNEGTPAILEALRRHNIKATFFINSRNLHDPKPHLAAQNANNLLAIIADGHVIGDHSYDHMAHNSKNSPKNAYKNVEEDLKYFGIMNTYPVLDILWKADMKEYIGPVNHTMTYYVRLPYTNAWRAGNMKRDCYACTIPGSSGQKGIEISNRLAEEKKLVFGWDQEWEIDWIKNRFKYGGKEMFFRLARDPRKKPQMIVLSHDFAHRPYEVRDEQKELEEFIHLAKESGYKFATIDKYKLE